MTETKPIDQTSTDSEESGLTEDCSYVRTTGRIAIYDDIRSAPHIIDIPPDETVSFIAALSSEVYEQAKKQGGSVSYTVIKEVTENFIHAEFKEVVVSILDGGNTIRFTDRGPGIPDKERVLLPGFSSATETMKKYIRGVGSGLPIVLEYLDISQGSITIEDNLGAGSVVTISMDPSLRQNSAGRTSAEVDSSREKETVPVAETAYSPSERLEAHGIPLHNGDPMYRPDVSPVPIYQSGMVQPVIAQPYTGNMTYVPAYQIAPQPLHYTPVYSAQDPSYSDQHIQQPPAGRTVRPPALNPREKRILQLLLNEDSLGITDVFELTGIPRSTISNLFNKLELAGLVMATKPKGHRMLTEYGLNVASSL